MTKKASGRGRGRQAKANKAPPQSKASAKKQKAASTRKTAKKAPAVKGRGRGRPRKVVDEEMESDRDDSADEEEVENSSYEKPKAAKGKSAKSLPEEDDDKDSQQSWEEYCYECQDGGNVMCCESCPKVAHYKCIGLKVAPKGDWWCKDCQAKRAAAQKKQTSNRIQGSIAKASNGRGTSGARQATITSMMPTRSARRAGK